MNSDDLIKLDLAHIWHPASQMKDYELFKPLIIKSARGSYIELEDGRKIIDAISSWWCKSLGHGHPRLKAALLEQVEKFEHVIFANTTHELIATLSEKLAYLMPGLNKVSYASDGSSAVEIAMKMSLHSRLINNEPKRTKFIALENAYHGETSGALSVSDIGKYRHPYEAMLFDVHFIKNIPYVLTSEAPLWNDCSEAWHQTEKKLAAYAATATALILEPIVQGSAGMKIYSQDFLRRIRAWTLENNIHLIADEIMTGIGRTGKMLACEHAGITPDFLCLSKGLTSGWLPLSVVLTSNEIYQYFYDDYQSGKAFLHSHTYSGNPLAASVALEVLNIFEEENICEQAQKLGKEMFKSMQEIASNTEKLTNVRGIGAIVAADLVGVKSNERAGYAVYQKAVELGAFLRPIGNTLYWLPPLNMDLTTLQKLKDITEKALIVL